MKNFDLGDDDLDEKRDDDLDETWMTKLSKQDEQWMKKMHGWMQSDENIAK